MTVGTTRSRGQPLLMLAALFMAWIGGRAILWESPFAVGDEPIGNSGSMQGGSGTIASAAAFSNFGGVSATFAPGRAELLALSARRAAPRGPFMNSAGEFAPGPEGAAGNLRSGGVAPAHQPVPPALSERIVTGAAPDRAQPAAMPRRDRWSLEAWAFWRDGSDSAAIAQGRVPSYGASQAAVVLNYRLAPGNHRDPRAYARAYKALIDGGEKELAAGLSARPLAALPMRMHAELRATHGAGRVDVRPAAFITSEFAPLALPLQMRAEAYVQAGYVGGRNGTGFADGQVHILRDLGKFDLGTVSLGTAAWGGAQKGAERLDIGPSLRFDVKLDKIPARLALDYRERVAGNAQPPSGAALTLSTRF